MAEKISVIVPVWGVEKYLDKCLDSLVHQSIPVKVIVVNDSSPDNSQLIIDRYKEMYPDAPIFSEGLLDIQRQNRELTIAERYSDMGNKIHDCASLDFFMRKFEDKELAYKAWIERKENTAYNVSRHGYIDKYGEFEGNRLFDLRCQKGVYHRSLAGLIERFGEEEGTKIYNERKERNKLSKSKEYVIQNHGEDYYNALCAKKALTLENFIRKYGDDLGTQKFLEYTERMQMYKNLLKNCIGNVC